MPAFFRLPPGGFHEDWCTYAVAVRIRKLVAQSVDLERIDPTAIPMLVAGNARTAEFRLHVLMEMLTALLGPGLPVAGDHDGGTAGHAYVQGDARLAAYLRTARGILALSAAIGQDGALADQIRIVFDGVRIPWDRFFFGPDEHRRLWDQRRTIGGQRPVTVLVRCRVDAVVPLGNNAWRVRCWFQPQMDARSRWFNLQIVLNVRGRALAERILRHRTVAVCGIPAFVLPTFPEVEAVAPNRHPFGQIMIPVEHLAQIHRYD